MNAAEFKAQVKAISSLMKGLTLQVVNSYSATPYLSLREFGNAILNAESEGMNLRVNQVWTSEGTVQVNTIGELVMMLASDKVQAIQFEAFYKPASIGEYINSYGE